MSRPASTRPGWLACYDELIGAWSRRSGNRHDAEDAAHDAVEHLLKADGSVAAKARGYLFQVAGHRLIDRWRRQRREQHVPLDELDEHDQPAQTDPEAPLRGAAGRRSGAGAGRAAAQVPPGIRVEPDRGLDPGRGGHLYGLSKNMIERYVMRAIEHVRERLHEHNP